MTNCSTFSTERGLYIHKFCTYCRPISELI